MFKPSPYNPSTGLGTCTVMNTWEAKHKERNTNPTPKAIEQVYVELGGRFGDPSALCWPQSKRDKCNRFKPVELAQ